MISLVLHFLYSVCRFYELSNVLYYSLITRNSYFCTCIIIIIVLLLLLYYCIIIIIVLLLLLLLYSYCHTDAA